MPKKTVNSQVAKETAAKLRIQRIKVEDVVTFSAEFLAGVIKSGSLESVHIPYFGKFVPKMSHAMAIESERMGYHKTLAAQIQKLERKQNRLTNTTNEDDTL